VKMPLIILVFLCSLLLFSGCATIFNGLTEKIQITSAPRAWARITDDKNTVVALKATPFIIELDKNEGYFKPAFYKVEIFRKGYLTAWYFISASVSGWYIGNLVIGGVIGMLLVDPATGAMWNLNPENINVSLLPKP
jgi:hypothetical protein